MIIAQGQGDFFKLLVLYIPRSEKQQILFLSTTVLENVVSQYTILHNRYQSEWILKEKK